MKKIFYHIAAAVLTLGLASCAKEAVTPEQPVTPEPSGLITIVANIGDDASTKTTLSGDDQSGYDVLWSEGDQIRFYGGESAKEYFTYTLTEGAGTKSGVFTGPAVPESIAPTEYAAYGDNLTFGYVGILAEEQYYAPNNGAFSFPMAAKISVSNGEVVLGDFKNIGGLLRLDLKGSGTVKEIKISANQPLSGGAIRIGEDGAAAFDSGAWLSSHKYVTLNCGASGVELTSEPKPFYISLLKNDYTGVKIEISDFAGHKFTKELKADKALNIARAQITSAPFTVTGLTNDNVPLTWDSPEGTRGILDGRECVVVNLGPYGKGAIATKNVGSSTEYGLGTYYTWIEAAGAQKNGSWGKGWHMPTINEVDLLGETYGHATYLTQDCAVLQFPNGQSLTFTLGGFYDIITGKYDMQGESGDFWGTEISLLQPEDTEYPVAGLSVWQTNFYEASYKTSRYKLPVRLFHKLPITRNTPVGGIGLIGDREAMVVEITVNGIRKKVAIATKNEGANSEMYFEQNGIKYLDCFGGYFTYAQAQAQCTDGWYIPSLDEAKGIIESSNYEITKPEKGIPSNMDWNSLGERYARKIKVDDRSVLVFQTAGDKESLDHRGSVGYYWTSTPGVKDASKQFVYQVAKATIFRPEFEKKYGISVRLFHEMPR